MEIIFTNHHNWEWIFQEAMKMTEYELNEELVGNGSEEKSFQTKYCEKYADLPSVKLAKLNYKTKEKRKKVEYSLFRIDLLLSSSAEKIISMVRATSPTFQRVDAKDLFFHKSMKEFRRKSNQEVECQYLPKTSLIPWNFFENIPDEKECEKKLKEFLPAFPSSPAVLKAPMGSGGFGIYFVYHNLDIIEIVKNHALRAHKEPDFLPKLLQSYSKEEISICWSLQEFIHPIKCQIPTDSLTSSLQRTQVRAYLVECQSVFYLYNDYEVRCPCWDIPLEDTLQEEFSLYSQEEIRQQYQERGTPWVDPVEEECCGKGFARPYNEKRNKKLTYRYMIEELPELIPTIPVITERLQECFSDLKDLLLREREEAIKQTTASQSSTGSGTVTLSVIGIDLLVSATGSEKNPYEVKIVEVNNNPAMPKKGKLMTERYESHLMIFHQAITGLTLHQSFVGNESFCTVGKDGSDIDKNLLDVIHRFSEDKMKLFSVIL
jgi:hypothetical protein